MAAQNKEINLLPKEKWETGTAGKLLKWALSIGRYIVVFTELVVISAFLYRFSLDRKLMDINEQVNQQKKIIVTYGDLETNFRTLQAKLTNISKAEKNSLDMSVILTNLSEITPLDTTYNSIDVEGQKVALEGQTLSEIGLATLLTKAQESKIFSGVSLDNVSSANEKSQTINFRMELSLKGKDL
ncbi:MAG: PilN domain-containing protein [Patescibacteria group bacterium]